MEKNIIELFAEKVVVELEKALAERQKSDPAEKSAMVRFNVIEVLKTLGATYASASASVNKDYTWLRVQASKDGFYYPIDFGQRRQATRAEVETLKKEGVDIAEAVCVAGIFKEKDAEGVEHKRFSMKWDQFFTGDGEAFAFSGPVRKWHEPKDGKPGYYDAPVAE